MCRGFLGRVNYETVIQFCYWRHCHPRLRTDRNVDQLGGQEAPSYLSVEASICESDSFKCFKVFSKLISQPSAEEADLLEGRKKEQANHRWCCVLILTVPWITVELSTFFPSRSAERTKNQIQGQGNDPVR
jgi:hypothetical protein